MDATPLREKLTAAEIGRWLRETISSDPNITLDDLAALLNKPIRWCRRVIRCAERAAAADLEADRNATN